MIKKTIREQTQEEEKINAVTHGLCVVFALIAVPFLIKQAVEFGTTYAASTVCVFGLGMFLTYLSSTVYHAAKKPRQRELWLICDHICIFLLIGGTYTPVIFRYLPFNEAASFMTIMWGIIILGIVFKLFFSDKYEWFSIALYVFLGWMLIFEFKPLAKSMSPEVLSWILYGCFTYTIGIVFYKWRSRKYTHAVWHCCVLLGTIAHSIAVYLAFSV